MKGEFNGVKWRSLKTDSDINNEYNNKLSKEIGELPNGHEHKNRNIPKLNLNQKRIIIYSKHGRHNGNNKRIL